MLLDCLQLFPIQKLEKAITKCGAYLLEINDSNLNTILKNKIAFKLVFIEITKDFNQSIKLVVNCINNND